MRGQGRAFPTQEGTSSDFCLSGPSLIAQQPLPCGWSIRPKGTSLQLCSVLPCRHALPLFTSLLNTVCAYDPVGYGIPYNHLLFSDYREPLVEEAAQVLIVTLDHDNATSTSPTVDGTTTGTAMDDADVRTGGRGGCGQMRPWVRGTPRETPRGVPRVSLLLPRQTRVRDLLTLAPPLGSLQALRTCL